LDFYGIGQQHPKILTKKFQFIFARTPNGVRKHPQTFFLPTKPSRPKGLLNHWIDNVHE